MADIASLIIRVTTNGVKGATSDLSGLAGAAVKAAGAIGGLAAAQEAFSTLINTQRNFDKLNAGLVTMTGSAENASEAFGALQKFAATTPYDLNQAVEGFTKLVALGLNPSQEALTSFGNTAAAMGKDLNQMIEAVADAATGEFERLKEFGIKAKNQGDTIAFTFRGTTTTIKNSSEAIQQYLIDIGNTDFAGAMANRMDTLDGALSNLDDAWEAFKLSVAQSGFGDAIKEQASTAADALQELTDSIASKEVSTAVDAWVELFDSSFSFIADGLNDLNDAFQQSARDLSPFGEDVSESIGLGFDTLPAYVAAILKDIGAQFSSLVDQAVTIGKGIAEALNPFGDSDWDIKYSQQILDNTESLRQQQKVIYDTRDAQIGAYKDAIENSKKLRKSYEEEKNAKVDLSTYAIKPEANSGPSAAEQKAAEKAASAAAKLAEQRRKAAESFIDGVKRQGSDEIAVINETERQKLDKLTEFQQQGAISAKQYEDTKTQIQLNAETARQEELDKKKKDQMAKDQKGDDFMAQILGQNAVELELFDIQQKQKEEVAKKNREQGIINEEEYQAALVAIASNYNKKRRDSYANMLGQTTDDLRSALGEGNKLYKAFAIANAIMNTYQAAVAAYQSASAIPVVGWVLGPVAAGAAVAAGLANVAKIRSARESGGMVNAGSLTMVGERNKAEFIMPASASRVRTAQQMRQIMGEDSSGKSSIPSIAIVNNTGSKIDSVQAEQDDEGRLRIIIGETVSGLLMDSNSNVSKSRRATRGQPGY